MLQTYSFRNVYRVSESEIVTKCGKRGFRKIDRCSFSRRSYQVHRESRRNDISCSHLDLDLVRESITASNSTRQIVQDGRICITHQGMTSGMQYQPALTQFGEEVEMYSISISISTSRGTIRFGLRFFTNHTGNNPDRESISHYFCCIPVCMYYLCMYVQTYAGIDHRVDQELCYDIFVSHN
jgi:hypothetical protein